MEKILFLLKRALPAWLQDVIRPGYHLVLAVIGETIYGFPGRKLRVIGVTGTNGKSTTCNLITAVLEADGHTVGMITTVNFQVGDIKWINETKMTSFGRFGTYRLLRRMVRAGCTHAVIEVSSHALDQKRVWAVPFQTAVFTNLTRDHLDYHKTMDAYRIAKGKLFAGLKHRAESVAVVNGDDPAAPYFLGFLADEKYVYGQGPAVAGVLPLAHTVIAEDINSTPDGSRFTARLNGTSIPLETNLPGAFNVSNVLAALSVGVAHQVKPAKIAAAIAAVKGVPGRMEKVEAGQPFSIIVDYAHTPDAFENVLKTLRSTTSGKLISVYGATGDRDRGKRPELGRIASSYSDFMMLTEEDPGSEKPEEIIDEILPGIQNAEKVADYCIISDRRQAIAEALKMAGPGDTVVLLAIGHQTKMVYASGAKPWNERMVAAEEWRKLGPA